MSDAELLLKEIEGLPVNYMGEILDFVGYLKHKAPPVTKAPVVNPYKAAEQEEAEFPPDFDPRLKGAVNPKVYGKVKTNGDIIGPFYEEWNQQVPEENGH
jgi:hypothetical protein